MKKGAITLIFTALLVLGFMQAQALAISYDPASHWTPAWQELATYDGQTKISDSGVFWSVDNGATWGHDTNLYVGQEVQFKFNMHKENVGTHYADFLKSWIDWEQDGSLDQAGDVVAWDYFKLTAYQSELGTNTEPSHPDFTVLSDTFTLTQDNVGDLFLRSRVTCSHSLAVSLGKGWYDQWDNISEAEYYAGFNPTGFLYQGEVEEWRIKVNSAPVPEPATMVLMGSGLLGMIGLRRRKK